MIKNTDKQPKNYFSRIRFPKMSEHFFRSIFKANTTHKQSIISTLSTMLFLLFSYTGQGMDLILTSTVTDLPNNQKRIDFIVEDGFEDIFALQFSINWNPSSYAFQQIDLSNSTLPSLTPANFGATLNNTNNGIITIAWFDPILNGVNLNNSDILFSLVLQQTTPFDLFLNLSNNPTAIEVLDVNENPINLLFNNSINDGEVLIGDIFFDEDENCELSSNEIKLSNRTILAEGNGHKRYATTNEAGIFQILLEEGDYEISVLTDPFDYWESCQPSYSVSVEAGINPASLELPLQKAISCPTLTLDISTAFLQPCSDHIYYLKYANRGNELAVNATVEIKFDSFLTVLESSIPWTFVDGNTYTFPVGNVPVGTEGQFIVEVNLSCDATSGQTHCTTAKISPNDFCNPSPLWSEASIKVTGTCEDDEVEFVIQNIGTEDMIAPLEFIVTEDQVMHFVQPPSIQLDVLAAETFSFPANGSTWRLESPQVENHPGFSYPITTVEGCGMNNLGSFSLGFVTPFPQDDGDLFVDIDCQENMGNFIPNEKIAFPTGFGNQHLIAPNTDIEYQIRFQNTGLDTVLNIVILDTLPPELDITSLRSSVSSHPYTMEVSGEGVLKLFFPNISLPNNSDNVEASYGFVKYRIAQMPDLPDGTLIMNNAAIYFDLETPLITNETFHTIGSDFFILNQTVQVFEPSVELRIFPNPIYDYATMSFQNMNFQAGNFLLFNQNGQLVQQSEFTGSEFVFHKNSMAPGFYFFKIFNENKLISIGKVVIRD